MANFELFSRPIQNTLKTALGEPFFLVKKGTSKNLPSDGLAYLEGYIQGIFEEIIYGTAADGSVDIIRDQSAIILRDEEVEAIIGVPQVTGDGWDLQRAKDSAIYGFVDFRKDAERSSYYRLQKRILPP